ncbi:hypothetical protein AX16_002729 [Volvariella volvacea WC 439]|nr:hypothetical protein AX16_002729 [Volvariella volvacea WC 439]
MRGFQLLAALVLSSLYVLSASAASTAKRNNWPVSKFITTANGQYVKNGKPFKTLGSNLYWLPTLNTWDDINNVIGNVSSFGFNSIRTWAFNDVDEIPINGTWFQHIKNGRTTINEGWNGLKKLDKVVKAAENHGVYLILTLTNNWNPRDLEDYPQPVEARDITPGTGSTLARNTLSNDFGGMDTYVRNFGTIREHDQFYLNEEIVQAFLHYVTRIVERYKDSPAILQWEIANDARCRSSLPASNNCNTVVTTEWFARVARHIKSIDPNHLVTAGTQGFVCVGCPRPYQGHTTVRRTFWERRLMERQSTGLGPPFNGYHGVDNEAINDIPQIDASTVSLFPDQEEYGPRDPSQSNFQNNLQGGLNWIQSHTTSAAERGKPVAMTGAGLVTQDNAGSFVGFNRSSSATIPGGARLFARAPEGVTNEERNIAYAQWFNASTGLNGALLYQYSQAGLTAAEGTSFPPIPGTNIAQAPNDGYSSNLSNDPVLAQLFADSATGFGL